VKLLLELSLECESLARAEAESAMRALGADPKTIAEYPGVLVTEAEVDALKLSKRLGLCHYVSEWLGTCNPKDLESTARGIDLEGPIRVRSTKVGEAPAGVKLDDVSRKIGAILGGSRGVDLRSPRSDVRVIFSDKVHLGKVVGSIDRASFEKRKNRNMPFKYPISVHPKFARALVNLTRVREHQTLLDPFCGTGAIIVEACLVGLSSIGSDLSEKMIEGARSNLRHIGVNAKLVKCDVGAIEQEVGHVAGIGTDPPYGRSTSTNGEAISALYSRSFAAFAGVLTKGSRVAVVVPELELARRRPGFRLAESHDLWVHRSLTRHFCVLERD